MYLRIGDMKRRSLEMIFGALNAANVRYLVVGGLAVVVHGYVRATVDVDLVIEPNTEARLRAVRALAALSPNHPDTEVRLFPDEALDFEDAYARARREEIAPGVAMTVVPLAELIAMKRRSSHPSDRVDLEALEIIDSAGGTLPTLDPQDESTWPWTPEQQHRDQILRQTLLSIDIKLDWLEDMQTLAKRFGARRREDLGMSPSGSA